MDRVVIDTNIFISAMMNAEGAPRAVLRLALNRDIIPVFGNALFSEYEAVLSRADLFEAAPASRSEREDVFDALLSVSEWTPIYFLWRPNLPPKLGDRADNHILELAIAGGAQAIITANIRDFERGEVAFPSLKICTAGDYPDRRRKR